MAIQKKYSFEQKDAVKEMSVIQTFPVVGNSPTKVFIHKKAERISIALHLVTNHIKDNEPAKWEVRNGGVEIVKFVSKLNRSNEIDRKDIIGSLGESVLRVLSSIEALTHVGHIAHENAALVKRELSFLVQLAGSHTESEQDAGAISESIFMVPSVTPVAPIVPAETGRSVRRVARPATPTAGASVSEPNAASGDTDTSDKGQIQKVVKRTYVSHQSGDIKDGRRSAIINLLKTESNLSVKDFVKVIPGVSEKTIQRELIAMSDEGVLSKTGARRWTRYSLLTA